MICKFTRKLTQVLYFLLITIILHFDKNSSTICPRRIYQPFLSELSAVKCNLIIIFRQILDKKGFAFLSNIILVRLTGISIFFFQCFKLMFSIDKPHYCCSAITQPMARFSVVFSDFNIHYIGNLITVPSKSLLFTGWGLTCISILFRLLY